MQQSTIKHTVISKPKVEKVEWEEESKLWDVRWRNVPVSSLRINSGAIWKTYLGPTCFNWEKRGEEKKWLNLTSWATLSPAGSYNIAAALSSSSFTLSWFHWLSQLLPINRYLPASLRAAGERQEHGMERDDDEGERRDGGEEKKQKQKWEKVRWGQAFFTVKVQAVFWIKHFHICNGDSRETGHRKTESQGCLSCWPPLISF